MKSRAWWILSHLVYQMTVLRHLREVTHRTSMLRHLQAPRPVFSNPSLKLRTANCFRKSHLSQQDSQHSTYHRSLQALETNSHSNSRALHHSPPASSNSNSNRLVFSKIPKPLVIRVQDLLCHQCPRTMVQICRHRRRESNHQCL